MVLPIQRAPVINVNIHGEVNRQLLKRLIATLPGDAHRLTAVYAGRVAATARALAPSSEEHNGRSLSGIPLSNNPHDVSLRHSIVAEERGLARFAVTMGEAEKWGRYIITGTRAHAIRAGRRSTSRTKSPVALRAARRRVSRIHQAQERIIAQMQQAEEHLQGRGRAIKDALGHVQGYAQRRGSLRNETARGRRSERLRALDEQLSRAEEAVHDARVGHPQLVFPWEGAPVNARGQQLFVGAVVHKKATRANNFLGRARSAWGNSFAISLRRLLEGRGVS